MIILICPNGIIPSHTLSIYGAKLGTPCTYIDRNSFSSYKPIF